jgi:hypothetical protein
MIEPINILLPRQQRELIIAEDNFQKGIDWFLKYFYVTKSGKIIYREKKIIISPAEEHK